MTWAQKVGVGVVLILAGIGTQVLGNIGAGSWAIIGGIALVVWGVSDHGDAQRHIRMAAEYERVTGKPLPADAALVGTQRIREYDRHPE